METSLHRQLKALYSADSTQQEVTVDGYRIDAVDGDRLIEIQYGSLGAISQKVLNLVENHDVTVVKPLAARKYLIKRKRKNGKITSKRYSPSKETFFDLFLDLVHFVHVFPHPRLTLEVLLTEQEEHRVAKKRTRWKGKDYRVEDRLLREVTARMQLRTAADLADFLPDGLPDEFTTAEIASHADIPRWLAQKMAYCLRKVGALEPTDKRGNTILYRSVSVEEENLAA